MINLNRILRQPLFFLQTLGGMTTALHSFQRQNFLHHEAKLLTYLFKSSY